MVDAKSTHSQLVNACNQSISDLNCTSLMHQKGCVVLTQDIQNLDASGIKSLLGNNGGLAGRTSDCTHLRVSCNRIVNLVTSAKTASAQSPVIIFWLALFICSVACWQRGLERTLRVTFFLIRWSLREWILRANKLYILRMCIFHQILDGTCRHAKRSKLWRASLAGPSHPFGCGRIPRSSGRIRTWMPGRIG